MAAGVVRATTRWGRFNLVGLGGFVLQVSAISLLTRQVEWPPMLATVVGLQIAVLHNFMGHSRWTWLDRPAVSVRDVARRFGRYQIAKAVSLSVNAGLTTWAVWRLHVPVELANAAAVALLSIANFVITDRFVFKAPAGESRRIWRVWPYVRLIKFRYHITFLNVLFGVLLFAPVIDLELAPRLVGLYLSFNVLLYGGLYTLNDLADAAADARHPQKRFRPVASGDVTPSQAAGWAALLVTAGMITGAAFGPRILLCYLAIVVLNIVYSCGGRDVRGADLLLNSLPHVVRFVMGVLLVDRQPPSGHLVALLFMAVALSSLRRDVEKDVDAGGGRPTLRRYTTSQLRLIVVVCLGGGAVVAVHGLAQAPGFYGVLGATTAVLVGGAYSSGTVRGLLRRIWTR